MPSPIAHALGGVTVAWLADLVPGRRAWRIAPPQASWWDRAGNGLTLTCALLAASPDLDLLFGSHRTVTHSIGAAAFVGLFAAALAANAGRPIARIGLMVGCAYGSHILLDWMGADHTAPYGIMALWPFRRTWYLSGWDLFAGVGRDHWMAPAVMRDNLLAVAQEVALVGPVVLVVGLVRIKALARLAAQVAGGHHASQ